MYVIYQLQSCLYIHAIENGSLFFLSERKRATLFADYHEAEQYIGQFDFGKMNKFFVIVEAGIDSVFNS